MSILVEQNGKTVDKMITLGIICHKSENNYKFDTIRNKRSAVKFKQKINIVNSFLDCYKTKYHQY